MKQSFVGGNNMNKSFAFGGKRTERNTYTASKKNFNDLANMKRSHGPLGMAAPEISAFRGGRNPARSGNKAGVRKNVKIYFPMIPNWFSFYFSFYFGN